MISYIVKVLLALGLGLFIYFIGPPGCSPTRFVSLDLDTPSCDEAETMDILKDGECIRISITDRSPPPDRSQKNPEKEPEKKSEKNPKKSAQPDNPAPFTPQYFIEFKYKLASGKVDIIFVVDNSSSMAEEHRNLAEQFTNFLRQLKNVHYHIAVITTDISSSPDNPARNTYYQDGKFIPIGQRIFLRNENIGNNPSRSVIEDFQRAIVREETERCDEPNQPRSSGNQYDRLYRGENGQSSISCPSHDERGTYALNLAIRNSDHQAFFRSDAHLMIVIISDEDIRSGEDYINQPGFEEYAFEAFDEPEVLVESIHNRFGKLKSFSVYPIIIIPGDIQCLNMQNAKRDQGYGTGRGYYGREYARLAKAQDYDLIQYGNLLEGKLISICSRNYGAQLRQVALSANAIRLALPCGEPESIDLYIDRRKVRPNYSIEGRTMILEPGEIRLGAGIELKVICPE